MFFKRERAKVLTFSDRVSGARSLGFDSQPAPNGVTLLTRKGLGAVIKETAGGHAELVEDGILVGKTVARLVHGGYQMFFLAPDGHKHPALAEHLRALHAFREDLTEALGIESLYNTALGSTCSAHSYDRVKDRDHAHAPRAWE